MVEIECLACEKTIKTPQYIDTEKYDGQMICQECEALLHIKLAKGKVQKYRIVERKGRPIDIRNIVVVRPNDKENGS